MKERVRATLGVVCLAVFSALLAGLLGCAAVQTEAPARFSALAGRYAADRFSLLEVEAHGDMIAVVPPFWTSKPYFVSDDGMTFRMQLPSPRPQRTLSFLDFDDGVPSALTLDGIDQRYDGQTFRRLAEDQPSIVELLLAGKAGAAAKLALEDSPDADALAGFALDALYNYRTSVADTTSFLERLTTAFPEHARLRALYGHALVAIGQRDPALEAFEQAHQLDPDEWTVPEGLRRLRFEEPPPGRGYRAALPFTLQEAYAPPTEDELASVRRAWAERDLAPRHVTRIATETIELDSRTFEARVVRHEVHGDAHYGAVFVPAGASPERPLPVVIDARGVNPRYSPLDVSRGTKTLRALGAKSADFVFAVPGFRGNTLILGGTDYVAEGDPSDAWDGATDDALAFLNAALEATPEADRERVAIIGYSRGGTVALLAGIRDPRIDLVLDVVGPVDHFVAMDDSLGWATAEILADALRNGTIPTPTQEGGQVFDHFFDRGETLGEVRTRLIASSPLYFSEGLPETHAYYGSEDRSVPLLNATLLRNRMADLGRLDRDFTLEVFAGRGHDTDPLLVQQATAGRLIAWAARSGP